MIPMKNLDITINCNFWHDPHDGKGPVREEPAAALGAGRQYRTDVRFHFGTYLWREGRRHGSTGRAPPHRVPRQLFSPR